MVPEVHITMLACARIGAVHTVVFSAFSGQSLKDRIVDSDAKVLVTADGYYRRGKIIDLKSQADIGAMGTSTQKIVVLRRAGNQIEMLNGRDVWWHDMMEKAPLYCEPEEMDSEDMLFMLYTSGTTGKPKGIVHITGGYLTVAYLTAKWDFDLHDDDVFWCTADIGWVTGHTYGCYGPLLNGATIVCYEGSLDYPSYGRWWEIIEKYAVTTFYTAPTAIRMMLKWGDVWPQKYDLSSLRLLGTVGEPINKEAWLWYFKYIGGERCPIIDTWWQTETGATLINSLPGIGPFIPTVAGRSFPGTIHDILDEIGQPVGVGEGGYVVQKSPIAPGMLRIVYKNPQCYKNSYYRVYGPEIYYTGDGAIRWDSIGNFRFTGRVDDIMKVSGHRLSTAEIENVLTQHSAVADCAVVAAPHEIKGEVPIAFVILKGEIEPSLNLENELMQKVAKTIGPIAKPERIIIADAWPKTQSGKTMRRVLKALVRSECVGDTTTMQDNESLEKLKRKLKS
jgi:acetyl-CoA synthetase